MKREAGDEGGIAVAQTPPRTRLNAAQRGERLRAKANHITVRHRHGDVVAVIELISPGNKASRAEFRTFVEKSADLLQAKIHLLTIDLFPPTRRGFPKALKGLPGPKKNR